MSKASDQVDELSRKLRGAQRDARGLSRVLPSVPRAVEPLVTLARVMSNIQQKLPRDSVRLTFRRMGL